MKKKYESLRLIAKFIYVVGYIFLFIGIIELLVLINGVNFLIELIGSSELNDLLIWIHGFTGLASIGILLSSIITYLIFTAISDIIKVFIDTEMNTAQLKSNSDKILLLLESKFGDKSVVVDSPPTIYSFLSEFGDNVESFLNRIIDKIKSQKKLKCPVCFGKGKISEKDIEILSLEFKGWKSDEACGFCRGIGKVTEHEHDAIWRDISNIYSAKLKGEEYFCVNDMTQEKDGNWVPKD